MNISDATLLLELVNAIQYLRAYAERTHGHWDADEDHKVGKRLLAMCGHLHGYDQKLTEITVLLNRAQVHCDAVVFPLVEKALGKE